MTKSKEDKNQENYSAIQNYVRENQNSCKIAIIDDGIDGNYISECTDTVNFTKDSSISSSTSHGTEMFKLIKSYKYGLATNSEISILKIVPNDGYAKSDDLIEAITWCIENNINIISISLATEYDNNNVHDIIKEASNNGIHIFASVSNESTKKTYPASYQEVIGVYSTINSSNYIKNNYLHLPITSYKLNDKTVSGNSPSTAICAAIATCYLSNDNNSNKKVTNGDLKQCIRQLTDELF